MRKSSRCFRLRLAWLLGEKLRVTEVGVLHFFGDSFNALTIAVADPARTSLKDSFLVVFRESGVPVIKGMFGGSS